jgi:hypothetical protein
MLCLELYSAIVERHPRSCELAVLPLPVRSGLLAPCAPTWGVVLSKT